MIRVYAQTERAKKWTLEQLVESKVKSLTNAYKGKQFKPPVVDKKYKKKFPGGLAKKAIFLTMVGRRSQTERTFYYAADCKNDRQYVLEIFVTGTQGPKLWEKQIKGFLKGFKVRKK